MKMRLDHLLSRLVGANETLISAAWTVDDGGLNETVPVVYSDPR